MAKRGPPFKASEKCSVEDVRQAVADVDLERRAREHVEASGQLKTFILDERDRSGNCRSKLKQIRAHRENPSVIWLDMSPPKRRKKKTK
jgi:hypothetical protein